MKKANNSNSGRSTELSYKVRMLGCIAVAELIAIAFVLFWPVTDSEPVYQDIVYSDRDIVVEHIERTTQESEPPPPPRPQAPIPVPNDRIIEEEIEFEDVDFSELNDEMEIPMPESEGDTEEIADNPQMSPSVIRIVEPTVPKNLEGDIGRIVIIMNFLVDREGNVEEANLSQIRKYEEDGTYTVIQRLNNDLMKEVLRVAHQWKFRPAKDQGAEVRAFATHEFTLNI